MLSILIGLACLCIICKCCPFFGKLLDGCACILVAIFILVLIYCLFS